MKRFCYSAILIALTGAGAFFIGRQGLPKTGGGPDFLGMPAPVSLGKTLRVSDPVRQQAEFGRFLMGLSPEGAASEAHEVWSAPGEQQEISERKRLFCYAWGKVAGAAAVEFARKEPGVGKVAAISGALAGWASQDPQAARQWISSRLEPGERLLHTWAFIDGWARHDPRAATEYVLSFPNTPGVDRFIRSIAVEMVRVGGPAAADWAMALPPGSLRQTGVEEVTGGWARTAPSLASDWAFALQDSALATRAVDRAITEWARADGIAAGGFLERQPASVIRDAAVSAYLAVLATEDLQAVSHWAKTIRNSSLREQSLRRIADEWMARNPEATLAWLPSSGLDAEAQKEIATTGEPR